MNESFKADYFSFRDEALVKTDEIDTEIYLHPFALYQMQLSLRFVYDYDEDEKNSVNQY